MYKLIGLLLLTGCSSLNFDSLEYDRFISISERTNMLISKCDNSTYVKSQLVQLKDDVTHMNNYAKFRSNKPEVQQSTSNLYNLIEEMSTQYEGSVSKIYCEQKLKTISTAADAIGETLGRI